MEKDDILEFDSLCDKVRFAVSVGDELTEEMNKHLESCEECRTFLEQTKKMTEMLSTMGVDTFVKDGKTVADCVMEEVKRQAVFTGRKPAKKEVKVFKHFGLVAACVVITVMALPLLKNEVLGSTKDSAKEYITEDAAESNRSKVSGNTAPEAYFYSETYEYSDGDALIEGAEEETYEESADKQKNSVAYYSLDEFDAETTVAFEGNIENENNGSSENPSVNDTGSLTKSDDAEQSEEEGVPIMFKARPMTSTSDLITDAVIAWMTELKGESFNPDILDFTIVEMDENRAELYVVYGDEYNSSVILVCTDGIWAVV